MGFNLRFCLMANKGVLFLMFDQVKLRMVSSNYP